MSLMLVIVGGVDKKNRQGNSSHASKAIFLPICSLCSLCAAGESRTLMRLPPIDFESIASTNSATAASD